MILFVLRCAGRNVATAEAVHELLRREAARPGAAWVSWDDAPAGHDEEGCEVAAEALQILQQTLSQRTPKPTASGDKVTR